MSQCFKPFYTWPNKAFPFRHLFKSNACNIFIIENIIHNYNWLEQYKDKINDKHFFFVYLGWHHDIYFLRQTEQIFSLLQLKKENFFFMYNAPDEKELFNNAGFYGDVINHNCWLDENLTNILNVEKTYNAILVARRSAWKRHYLASKVDKLALIAGGGNHNNPQVTELPPHIYNNETPLKPNQVFEKINQSYCGLCLSEKEGASFSSSEYLLCGVPVVSTHSLGGRDIWYNDYNSIVCDDNEDAVAESVNYFLQNTKDPAIIRNMHIKQSQMQRDIFTNALQNVFDRYHIKQNALTFFKETFIHKLRSSTVPNFVDIF